MKIIIGGATGFIGRQLIPALLAAKHQLVVIGRDKAKISRLFPSQVEAAEWNDLNHYLPDHFDAIINLTGENIAERRWSRATMDAILNSRLDATNRFVTWSGKAATRHPHLYNASAVGYYGLQKEVAEANHAFAESSQPNDAAPGEFASALVKQWEDAASAGQNPVTLMRFGVVLKRGEGMLKKLEFPARLGLGAVIGSGSQPLAWIDSDDLVNAIIFLLNHPDITGPVNLVAPECVSQKTFTQTLARTLKKPALLWLPAPVVKLLFGQMGEELLLSGQTVAPERLQLNGYTFAYPTLQASLEHAYAVK